MTTTTSEVCVRKPDGSTEVSRRVLFAMEGVADSGERDVLSQLRQEQPDNPQINFTEHGGNHVRSRRGGLQRHYKDTLCTSAAAGQGMSENVGERQENLAAIGGLVEYALSELSSGETEEVGKSLQAISDRVEDYVM